MSTTSHDGQIAGSQGAEATPRLALTRLRWLAGGAAFGLLLAAWSGGLSDRYGEPEGFVGTMRSAWRHVTKGVKYASAHIRDCCSESGTSVRNLGLGQQIETRLCQDKKLDAEGITVQIDEEGTAVLRGLVPDAAHKDKALALTRDTRGVMKVVDHLAVPPSPRVVNTPEGDRVTTGVASQAASTLR
jgi:hypothetical protein